MKHSTGSEGTSIQPSTWYHLCHLSAIMKHTFKLLSPRKWQELIYYSPVLTQNAPSTFLRMLVQANRYTQAGHYYCQTAKTVWRSIHICFCCRKLQNSEILATESKIYRSKKWVALLVCNTHNSTGVDVLWFSQLMWCTTGTQAAASDNLYMKIRNCTDMPLIIETVMH